MELTRTEIEDRLYEQANAHTALMRAQFDIKREYRNPSGLEYVLGLLKEAASANENVTLFLQFLSSQKEEDDRRGNMSIAEMEKRKEADNNYWDSRIERKRTQQKSQGLTPFTRGA